MPAALRSIIFVLRQLSSMINIKQRIVGILLMSDLIAGSEVTDRRDEYRKDNRSQYTEPYRTPSIYFVLGEAVLPIRSI
jgi:hypothetical protein